MTNLTLAIPEELHSKMKKHSEIRWSEVVRKTIAEKIETLEILDKIAQKSKLKTSDVKTLSRRIKKELFRELDKAA